MCEDLQLMSRRTWHCHKQIWSDGFVITLLDQACPCQKLGVISNNQETLSLMLTWNVNFWMTRCENACMKQKSRKTIRPGLSQLTAQSQPSLSKFAKKVTFHYEWGHCNSEQITSSFLVTLQTCTVPATQKSQLKFIRDRFYTKLSARILVGIKTAIILREHSSNCVQAEDVAAEQMML